MAKKMEAAIRQITLDRATFENTGTTIVPTYINFFFGRNGSPNRHQVRCAILPSTFAA